MSVDLLLSRLDRVRQTGRREWIARCPAHEDRRPSLSVAETPDGRILIHDFAGCSAAEVLAALDLDFTDLFPQRDHDDVGRRDGWRSGTRRDSRQSRRRISARTALLAIAHDATEAAVLVLDAAEGRVHPDEAQARLFTLAGRIADALLVTGVLR